MATISSDQVAAGVQSRNRPDGAVFATQFQVTVPSTLAQDDVIRLCKLPRGARVLDVALYITDLDTNVSPALVFKLGTSESTPTDRSAVYGTAITTGQAAGLFKLGATGTVASTAFTYDIGSDTDSLTVETYLQLTCTTAAGTAAAGTIKGHVLCAMQK